MPWNNQNGGGGWQSGGGNRGPWGQPPSGGGGGQQPDLEELLRRSQDRLRRVMPGGGSMGGRGVLLVIGAVILAWLATGIYRVDADEEGVVLRFGEYVRSTPPGLHYHLPYPIETALTPQVTTINRTDVGMRVAGDDRQVRAGAARDVPEESLMLTGDENIVDVDFSVFWRIGDAGNYLFQIEDPVGTVKAVAESAMREVIGQSDIQPILTEARAAVEQDVQALMQNMLEQYTAGILVTQVKMQKVDPPGAVIDAFRDVQAARADLERARNEAEAYANKIIPEARGDAARTIQQAEAYREQTIAEAEGQAQRFVSIYNEYRNAPAVTRQRMYLETMENVFGDMAKIIIDDEAGGGSGVVPYLPLNELQRPARAQEGQ